MDSFVLLSQYKKGLAITIEWCGGEENWWHADCHSFYIGMEGVYLEQNNHEEAAEWGDKYLESLSLCIIDKTKKLRASRSENKNLRTEKKELRSELAKIKVELAAALARESGMAARV